MTMSVGVVMDPLSGINKEKDTTLAMIREAIRREFQVYYVDPGSIFWRNDCVFATRSRVQLNKDQKTWFHLSEKETVPLANVDVVLMRKDPPFSLDYIYLTYLLEHVEKSGTLVVNKPQGLRDANEKLFTLNFPQCMPETIVTSQMADLYHFLQEYKHCVCKPLDGMAGQSVFQIKIEDENTQVIFETITEGGTKKIMMQRFIPEVYAGDKRIIVINGEPYPFALARIPKAGDFRGNLAAGARGEGMPLSENDYWICEQVSESLRARGLYFVGLDVLGDYLTEINVTSPTGVQELDRQYGDNICGQLFDFVQDNV
jgi:glutathione synthase